MMMLCRERERNEGRRVLKGKDDVFFSLTWRDTYYWRVRTTREVLSVADKFLVRISIYKPLF